MDTQPRAGWSRRSTALRIGAWFVLLCVASHLAAGSASGWGRDVRARKAMREADQAFNRRDDRRALLGYRQYLEQRGPATADRSSDAKVWAQIAQCAERLGRYDRAMEAWATVLGLELARDDRPSMAAALRRLAQVKAFTGHYREGRGLLRLSVEVAGDKPTPRDEADTLRCLALLDGALGRYDSQRQAATEAAELYRRSGDPDGLAASLGILATFHRSQGHFDAALAVCQQAMDAARTSSVPDLAPLHLTRASIHRARGDARAALRSDEEALELARESAVSEAVAVSQMYLGLDAAAFGEHSRAQESLEGALQMFQDSGALDDQARVHLELGRVAFFQRRETQSLQHLRLARDLYAQGGQTVGVAIVDAALGRILLAQGDAAGALAAHEAALGAFKTADEENGVRHETVERGFALAALGRHEEALASFDAVSPEALGDLHWRAWQGRAQVLAARGDVEGAVRAYDRALDQIENMVVRSRIPEFRASFLGGADRATVYDEAIELLARQGRAAQALELVERVRARSFLDLASSHRIELRQGVDADLLAKERSAGQRVHELSRALAGAPGLVLPTGVRQAEPPTSPSEELDRLKAEHHHLLERIAAESPQLASLVSVPQIDAGRLERSLAPDDQALVYHLGRGVVQVFLIGRDSIRQVPLAMQPKDLRARAEVLRIQLEQRIPHEKMARELYDLLVGPVEDGLHARHLIVAPHDVLNYVPFQVLQDRRGRTLLERFAISTVPSLTALATLRARPARGHRTVVALAVPGSDSSLPPLGHTTEELRAIQLHFAGARTLTGAAATEEAVQKEAAGADILHFACHGLLEPELPLFSGLCLSRGGGGDGRLELHEVFGLELRCGLTVLSACQTGLGQLSGGDELVCLARSFLHAGSSSIVASLWSVDDRSTAVFMERFYAFLARGESRDRALQAAGLALASSPEYREPYFWAPFCLIGAY